jgi:hypothetical protein
MARTVLDPIGESELGVAGYLLPLFSGGTGGCGKRPDVIAPPSVPLLLAGMSALDDANRDRGTMRAEDSSSTGWTDLPDFDSGPTMVASALGAEGSWFLAGDTKISWPANSNRPGIAEAGSGASNRERGVERAREGPSSTAAAAADEPGAEPSPAIAGSRLVAYHSVTGRMVR